MACAQCGYNLRGLDPQGRCPECGFLIANSAKSNLLDYAEPHWLERLAHGTVIRCWTLAVVTLYGVLDMVLGVSFSVSLASYAVLYVADWQLTAPEPGRGHPQHVTLRYAFRLTMTIFLIATQLQMLFRHWLPAPLVIAPYLFVSILGVLYTIFLCLYLRRLSLRVPDSLAWRQWTVLMVAQVVSYAVVHDLSLRRGVMRAAGALLTRDIFITCQFVLYGVAVWQIFLQLRLRKQLLSAAAGHAGTPAVVPSI
jgi:hypothetical protein